MCDRVRPRNLAVYITTIGVIDECRRGGIGSEMLAELEREAAKEFPACRVYYLHVIASNKAAVRFYEKNGYKSTQLIKNYYRIEEKEHDAMLVVKIKEERIEVED